VLRATAFVVVVLSVSGCGDKEKCDRALDDIRLTRQQLHNGVFTLPDENGAGVPNLNALTETARKLEEAKNDSVTYCHQ
jgi:hypothetical protein